MRPFLICLSPAILGFVLILVGAALQSTSEGLITGAMVLFGVGALMSAACVAGRILRRSENPSGATWLGAVLAFIGVSVAYFAMTMGGCCGLVMATQ